MKKSLVFILFVFLFTLNCRAIDTSGLRKSLSTDARDMLKDVSIESFSSEKGLAALKNKAFSFLKEQLSGSMAGAFSVFAVCALFSIVGAFSKSSGLSISEKAVESGAVCAIAAISFSAASGVLSACLSSIKALGAFSTALIPTFAAAMAVSGRPISSVAVNSLTMAFSSGVILLAQNAVLPLTYGYMVISSAGLVGESDLMAKGAELLRKGTVWCFRSVLIIYTFFLTVTGTVAGSADAAAVKTAKAAISGAVPVLGSILSDSSEALLSGAAVLKSSIGAFGAVACVAICLGPFISALVKMTVFRILSLFASSLSTGRVNKMLEYISNGFGLALGALGTCCTVLFISMIAGASAL